jgi:hypothetical protein
VCRVANRGSAHELALLLATSPWYLWVNASYMTHAITLVLCLGGWLLVAQRTWRTAFAGGVCMGLICLVRPLAGLAVGALIGAGFALLYAPDRGTRTRRKLGRKMRRLRDRSGDSVRDLKVALRKELQRVKRA